MLITFTNTRKFSFSITFYFSDPLHEESPLKEALVPKAKPSLIKKKGKS